MILHFLPLVNWTAGIITGIVFFLVSIGLVVALLMFLYSGKKKK